MHYDHPPEARCLKMLGRIAIWNREKIVYVTAMGILVTDFAILVNGEHLLQIMGESIVNVVISQLPHG
jgi:hypothetical protein